MAMRQFKAESKKLLDLMINSIYTNREIFLRELISNASDACDKRYFKSLTDTTIGITKDDLKIHIQPDKDSRTLTISDNGIGMTKEDLEKNLGTIAKSGSLDFKTENQSDNIDIIGQFGVGFYSAFMVAKKVTVISRAQGADTAWKWESTGVEGYTLTEADKDEVGTEIILVLKDDTDTDNYSEYLEEYTLANLVKKYSDYIRFPITMFREKSRQKPKPEDAGDDYKPEYETYSKKACARLLGIGIPMGLQCSITAIGSVIMQWAVNVLGSTAVAAVTAAGKTQGLLTVPMESVGTAMATYAGQNLGASRMDRVRKGVNSAILIILIYGVASAFVLHFVDVQIMGLFLDTAKEVDIVAMGREYLFWNSVFFVPLGALIVWRYTIQGLGFSTLAMMAGVAEMVARTVVAIALVPVLGYFGAELSNPAAWIAACVFLYPAYIWTCRQLDNRLLAAKLHIQGDHAEPIL